MFRFYASILISFLLSTSWDLIAEYDYDPGRFDFTNPGQKSVRIPFHTFNNQIIIPMVVNGKIALNFVLDSGTSQAMLFDRKLAKDLGLTWDRKIEFAGAGNSNRVWAYRTSGVNLELPGISGEMMGMVVLDQDYLNMHRFDIHGVIGYQLLVRFAVSLDYQNRIMTLMEPDQYDASGFQAFDITLENCKPLINTEILLADNSRIPSRLMVDTGAAYGLALITDTHPRIKPPARSIKMRLASGLSGDIHGHHGITHIKINSDFSHEVITFYVQAQDYTKRGQPELTKTGTIGGEFLIHYRVILDYINEKIYLKPNTPFYLTRISP